MDSKKSITVRVNLKDVDVFRPAFSGDIYEDNVVFLVGDGSQLIRMVIEEVIDPYSEFKAFTFDGCRYGLDGLYVLRKDSELHAKITKLENKISLIKEALED